MCLLEGDTVRDACAYTTPQPRLPPSHTPKTPLRNAPHRIQYGRRRNMIILYTHIVELSATLITIQYFYLITY